MSIKGKLKLKMKEWESLIHEIVTLKSEIKKTNKTKEFVKL